MLAAWRYLSAVTVRKNTLAAGNKLGLTSGGKSVPLGNQFGHVDASDSLIRRARAAGGELLERGDCAGNRQQSLHHVLDGVDGG